MTNGINLTIHLEYDEVVERLKAEGWVIPVRCKDCMHREPTKGKFKNELPYFCTIHRGKFRDLEEFCSFGEQLDGSGQEGHP